MRAILIDQRRAVATLEAVESWWSDRGAAAHADLAVWERRLAGSSDPELVRRVRGVVAELDGIAARAARAFAEARNDLAGASDALLDALADYTAAVRTAAAYGYDVSGLELEVDEPRIRADAADAFRRTIPEEPQTEDRAFLDELFRRREAGAALH